MHCISVRKKHLCSLCLLCCCLLFGEGKWWLIMSKVPTSLSRMQNLIYQLGFCQEWAVQVLKNLLTFFLEKVKYV